MRASGVTDRVAITLELPAGALAVQAAPPLRVSQRTVLDALGLSPRVYLDALPSYEAAGGEVLRVGKARLVDPCAFLRWIAERQAELAPPASGEAPRDEDTVDGAARRLGLRVVGGRP